MDNEQARASTSVNIRRSLNMKVFPTTELKFSLTDSQDETLGRLKRRTEPSENLTSKSTSKSFRGKINGSRFQIISSAIGSGAFCILTGEISNHHGMLKVQIHKVFRVLLSLFLLFPIIGLLIMIIRDAAGFPPVWILVAIGGRF